MTLAIAAILTGFIGLIWSADRFVEGAAALAMDVWPVGRVRTARPVAIDEHEVRMRVVHRHRTPR